MSKTFVIAEIGVNHQGKVATAKQLIEVAKESGADAAKFQFFNSKKLWGDERIRHLELRFDDMVKLAEHCKSLGIEFMCTPFGVEEVILLKPLLQRIKIASGCVTRMKILEAANDTKLPVVLSTGMSSMVEIEAASEVILGDLTLLHCTSSYPCRLEDVNLKAMDALQIFGCDVGYSDHTAGITVAIAAVARGAVMIEKHLTLSRDLVGPDHKASITPREFKAMTMAIREVEYAMGDGEKKVLPCEAEIRAAWHGN